MRAALADDLDSKADSTQFDPNSAETRYTMAKKQGAPILKGALLKRNEWRIKQERYLELYADGQLKYFTNDNKRE